MREPDTPDTLVAIGGLDPSAHAGILADARVWERLGRRYRVAVTAITAQSERCFYSWREVELRLFRQQLEAAGKDILGVKIGMLATGAHLGAVLNWLRKVRPRFLVWDPVWRSSTGGLLSKIDRRDPRLRRLWRLCDAFTPNIPEAERFLGRGIRTFLEAEFAAARLLPRPAKPGALGILKGGHLRDPAHDRESVDFVISDGKLRLLRGRRHPCAPRGTGCAFAAALLAALCRGLPGIEAVRFAKKYVLKNLNWRA